MFWILRSIINNSILQSYQIKQISKGNGMGITSIIPNNWSVSQVLARDASQTKTLGQLPIYQGLYTCIL